MTQTPQDGRAMPVAMRTGPCAHQEPQSVQRCLNRALQDAGLDRALDTGQAGLFSPHTVFATAADLATMRSIVGAIGTVTRHPLYIAEVLARSPATARHDPGNPGAFFGYDFHITPAGPQLIEINTNAGGMLLSIALLRAHLACCAPLRNRLPGHGDPDWIEAEIVAMMNREWNAAGREGAVRSIAIVDDHPAGQFLRSEFVMYQKLFERHGIRTLIADPSDLTYRDNMLSVGESTIDLVYNRLTDFALEDPAHGTLLNAYRDRAVVVTPHPRAHALFADKRNLEWFTDSGWHDRIGLDAAARDTLRQGIATTRIVNPEQAERLWSERKQLFFKPFTGYGSKAVYRGDKVTRRVWDEILASSYVAQRLVPPSELPVEGLSETVMLKSDVRHFVYEGATQLVSARLYQGQTTNFRTPGGGFAPVFVAEPPESLSTGR